jgi:hypothetical protein
MVINPMVGRTSTYPTIGFENDVFEKSFDEILGF